MDSGENPAALLHMEGHKRALLEAKLEYVISFLLFFPGNGNLQHTMKNTSETTSIYRATVQTVARRFLIGSSCRAELVKGYC